VLAVCPGSFDPITYGHLDVITRAARLFDEVLVAVGQNSTKRYLFSPEERVELARAATADIPGVRVEPLSGLLVDFVAEHGGGVLVKGVRFASDFDFELQMAHLNSAVGRVETIILPASPVWGTLSSTMIREIATHGGDVSEFVPEVVSRRIRQIAGRKEQADG
jgi:pantetheine-phosphate adenylyltransferase